MHWIRHSTVLVVIIILALFFFISALLHLLVRFLSKRNQSSSTISQYNSNRHPEEMSGSGAFQRQLQQLFHLHDSGLDQAFIDTLPIFLYREIKGLQEPFDCAVCLCEFSEQDKLRLLPLCSHAFHIGCIDTWLLSNSTCPLCRGTLFTPGFSIENPIFEFDVDPREEEGGVFPVRLGKFRSTNVVGGGGGGERKEEGETSRSNLDARRCYSLGSFQYVVANSNLQVALCPSNREGIVKSRGGGGGGGGRNGNLAVDGDTEGKRIINMGSKGDSFSVSKIWQWSKKGKLPSSYDTHMVTPPVNVGWGRSDVSQAT